MSAANKILTTVNAPYGTNLSACDLAVAITNLDSVRSFNASTFSFFSEVDPQLQEAFISEMGIDKAAVVAVASEFEKLSGHKLTLAA